MGDVDYSSLGELESSLKYHSYKFEILTLDPKRVWGQCMVGSLTGAVSSQRVTEERDGTLGMDGNHADSVKA